MWDKDKLIGHMICKKQKNVSKPMEKNCEEKEIFVRIVQMLLNEKVIDPEEHIRFLRILNEEG